ncbi:MAG TPA: bifunctional transaldolase/phosoglucose isomerase [Thermoleophilaceae bacterium]|nr:bifunctional transaldolase/phosoglucose isomerase [Thermoleophilaceae bacterium]
MSVQQTGVNERLRALTEAGTSVWLDQIRRNLIEAGELDRLVREDSLRGVTSNPSIFEKAILGSDDYDEDIRRLAEEGLSAKEIYEAIAVKDVQLAADVLRGVWDETGGHDGFVSLEVSPDLALDTSGGTLREARDFWSRVDRPNLMIKIPGTDEGLDAIEEAIADGINVNVTLLFSVAAYERVTEAYIRGMERRLEAGESMDVHSVASFFVSRVDSEVDKRLEAAGAAEELQGTAAVANARAAYTRFKEIFEGDRFARLRDAGCPVQRPLWASTGVKNPHYPDTKYVDDLVAPDTVNTMPMPTLLAAAERAEVSGATADQDASAALAALAEAGVDMEDVTKKLLTEGIEAFVKSFDSLIEGVEQVREAIVTGRPPTIRTSIPDDLEPGIAEKAREVKSDDVAQRVWRRDDTLWGEAGAAEVADRLGWLTISEPMLEEAADLEAWVEEVKRDGLTDCALLGMGGSSLGPEVIRASFGPLEHGLRLHVLDSTDAGAVAELERSVDLGKTLFLVSSKSGGTIETLSHFRYFFERTGANGAQFVAITDPNSPLQKLAEERGFRRVFCNDPEIGGRYSVMSYFGIVPAALMGANVRGLLNRCQVAEQNCTNYDSTVSNSGLWLGIAMGALALERRDKLTFVVSDPIASFGLWVEQLIAESTGKEAKGILPVADEPLGTPDVYGDDRVFAYLRDTDAPDEETDAKVEALAKAGHPVITLATHGALDLGRIFFFAEFATAVAGWALGINPFDQPNVQEAKDNTAKVLEQFAAEGALPEVEEGTDEALRELLGDAEPPNYVAVMGYVQPSAGFDEAVADLRQTIRDVTRCTTTFGYGPRFLHSTGQFHKGGPPTGRFLQLIHDGDADLEIPEAGYSFTTLKNAQATGDLQTLRAHGLLAERVRLEGDPAEGVRALTERIRGLIS